MRLTRLPMVRAATPQPFSNLHLTTVPLNQDTLLHRVHLPQYAADEFNPGKKGNARFSPIVDKSGKPIPTLYAGDTMACALMETVFHDVPYTAGLKTFSKSKLTDQVHSVLRVDATLQLVDLSSVALRKLGLTRKQLIDTEKYQYPATRRWAAAIHAADPTIQGLTWMSRQDDTSRALILFGDRIGPGSLGSCRESRALLEEHAYDEVLNLAGRLGVNLVP